MNISKEYPVLNAMEPIVANVFQDNYLKSRSLACDCEKCQLDILLLALNQLPPRYTSSQAGEVYIKALYMNPQLQLDILKVLTQAVQVIEDKPGHP